MDLSHVPLKIGRYNTERELGQGAMGAVFLAHDPFADRYVAIKTALLFPSEETDHMDSLQKIFFKEARAAGRLNHPHIAAVYDAAVENNMFFLVMEYVGGHTLKEYCRKESLLSTEKVVRIIFQCAMALEHAHQNDVIHGDIQPGNILISSKGEAKISDFGIAAIRGSANALSNEGLTCSVYYKSPEEVSKKAVTPQSDLFSLGVVMYELLTGAKPFVGGDKSAILYSIENKDPVPLQDHRRDIPESLEKVVARAMEKNPGNRYLRGSQMASELSAIFGDLKNLEENINFCEKFNAINKIEFFKDFTSSELAEVIKSTQWLKTEKGETIIAEGRVEECFYVLVTGKVQVSKHGRPIAILKHGDCFGEMAYLGKTRRTATIETLGEAFLMKIDASAIDQMVIDTQLRFYRAFSVTLLKRLNRTNELLVQGI